MDSHLLTDGNGTQKTVTVLNKKRETALYNIQGEY